MNVWHLTPDAPRSPHRVAPGERVQIHVGTWPVEPGQSLELSFRVEQTNGEQIDGRAQVVWHDNHDGNSYWLAEIGPFSAGDVVSYRIDGDSLSGREPGPHATFRVGPKLWLCLLWHQHQPLYRDPEHAQPRGSYRQPWVRLHAIRDYYAMASIVAAHPAIHVTINLTPVLLQQIDDYTTRGATDRALELSRKRVADLTADERREMQRTFFDADRHNQIAAHPRYDELFVKTAAGEALDDAELGDLAMWFSLAWFGKEFRDGPVELVTGERVDVSRFVAQGRNFSHADTQACVEDQLKVMRAIVPMHRQLAGRGQIEVTTTPLYHPILPLVVDTDQATIDRPGTTLPRRFAWPADADAHVRLAVEDYVRRFDKAPRGMWPAEGAVAPSVISLFARHGIQWIASDEGVLSKSGRWGYDISDPEVVCQPYRALDGDSAVSVFFRDTGLSDAIGFRYQHYDSAERAARDFVEEIEQRLASRLDGDTERTVTVVLDGENAWGTYPDDGRPFLHALYSALAASATIGTATFSEIIGGNPERGLPSTPAPAQRRVHSLYTGSWIDERSSAPGVDLGTWIGEPEENRAWELLGDARDALAAAGVEPGAAPEAFDSIYAAEGSDWFWWFGDDQDSGHDDQFDELFRAHLAHVYRAIGREVPAALSRRIVAVSALWRPGDRIRPLQVGDRLTIRTNCPGVVEWRFDDDQPEVRELSTVGGVMGGGIPHYQLGIGPVPPGARRLAFRFHCTRADCARAAAPCDGHEQGITIE